MLDGNPGWRGRVRKRRRCWILIMISLVIRKLRNGVWEKGLPYPPEAPVIKARRPYILLSTIFFWKYKLLFRHFEKQDDVFGVLKMSSLGGRGYSVGYRDIQLIV
jgi:hypothetical protein